MFNPNYGKLRHFCFWGVVIYFLYFKFYVVITEL